KVANVKEMRKIDQSAMHDFKMSDEILMENAGNAVYQVISTEMRVQGAFFVILCGIGNNGGDGLVVARKLQSNLGLVKVFLLGEPEKFKGAAKKNYEIAKKLNIEMEVIIDIDDVQWDIDDADAIVDAMFGTGLDREVKDLPAQIINVINAAHKLVFSVDIPSGINGDSGEIMGTAIIANYTITFGLPKLGNLLYPGFDFGGKLYYSTISLPPTLLLLPEIKVEINFPTIPPVRMPQTHKGDYGKTLFIAGSASYLGAPRFAALSFLKAGGGLSYLAMPGGYSSFLGSMAPELVLFPLNVTDDGAIALENTELLLDICDSVDFVVIGPGLSLNEETQLLVRTIVEKCPVPVLIDGDGVTAVAGDTTCIKKRQGATILTPHPGEMMRLTGKNTNDILENPIKWLQKTTQELNAIIVLKMAHTLIGYPDGKVLINTTGNPGMATAGCGDVLTGTIAAMKGIGLALEDAVRTGVFIHSFAGDLAARKKGEDGMIASDIMQALPGALKMFRRNLEKVVNNTTLSITIV
ncbi:NAD(P)H-hydrate dehydratase, partial [candidate division KSB1 bacterium]|nr:NAD(P)H-hydrate dehydratase [candidate division KSB1 bacterium]